MPKRKAAEAAADPAPPERQGQLLQPFLDLAGFEKLSQGAEAVGRQLAGPASLPVVGCLTLPACCRRRCGLGRSWACPL